MRNMDIGVLGVDHQNAPFLVREAFTRAVCDLKGALQALPSVPLLTCNRAEIYFSSKGLAGAHFALDQHLQKRLSFALSEATFHHLGRDCFTHLARVTAGLESAIVAETDIQRQVKQAYANAATTSCLPASLHFLFQKSLKIAKSIRSQGEFFSKGTSMEAVLYDLGKEEVGDIQKRHILFLGHSTTNRKIVPHFVKKGASRLTLCTRRPQVGKELNEKYGIAIQDLDALGTLSDVSMVIAATKADSFLISRKHPFLQQSKVVICDLSVPRVVDPSLSICTSVALYNMEDLSTLVQKKRVSLGHKLRLAEEQIGLAVARQIEIYHNKLKKVSVCA